MMQDDDDDDDDDNDDPMILNNRAKNHTSERTIVPWMVIFIFIFITGDITQEASCKTRQVLTRIGSGECESLQDCKESQVCR